LLFITLIENAFKHGVSNNKPSFIHIDIRQENGKLDCLIENSFFPKDRKDKSGSGIGLPNLEKRLALIYPGNYTFLSGKAGDNYRSSLSIQLSAL
jgi:LytS/YehU family sensor histidine kinase